MESQVRRGLNSNQIKLIAIIAMTIDHITWLLFPGFNYTWWVMLLHVIGRLTAPIMWFFIAEGYHYTHNVGKYILRLFVFAFISHFAYNFAGGIPFIPNTMFNATSVMWSLAWAVVLMVVFTTDRLPKWLKIVLIIAICFISFPADWSTIAAMCPVYLYINRGDFKKQSLTMLIWVSMYVAVYFIFMDKIYGLLQFGTLLSLLVLKQYNGERGSWKGMKWLFYIYYPAHLFVIGAIRVMMGGGSIFP
ncbi:TraX family protein [Butyrivibrio sp. XBB1001]|uniref:TraX family protein n=1 Tax=Butyrivibrio sp. XBB1001 TaxID=1280682 RepID=UPI000479FAAB|nr:TraX family protein [Butyrivibrio sp. XBB1001]